MTPLRPEDLLQLLTLAQAAKMLSVSVTTLRKWHEDGRLPTIHLGRAVRIRLTDVNRIIQEGIK